MLIRTSIPYKLLLHTNTTTAHGHGTPHGPARPPRQPRTRRPPPPPRCHLASTDVPQPIYVYGLLLGEFQVTIPPSLFTPYIPPTSTPLPEARKHLEHQGEVEADMALSKWFLCGADGAFEKDEALAYTFAEKAARKGLPSAEFAMGYYAEVGVGGLKDLQASVKCYKRVRAFGSWMIHVLMFFLFFDRRRSMGTRTRVSGWRRCRSPAGALAHGA